MEYKRGQRWISEMEPELGLGIVLQVSKRIVQLQFPASQCERTYATASAPLKRVAFKPDDMVRSQEGQSFQVTAVSEADGIIIYHGEDHQLYEYELADTLSFTTPQDRLLNTLFDHNRDFNLRYRTLNHRYRSRRSSVRGFTGGRINLIPHQLYVAATVAAAPAPRVLLSDETGLGKTIEASLIVHRLLNSERISRVLILLPETLVHQWFVELLRKFNLKFTIFDKPYCDALSADDPDRNPFLQEQLAICSTRFLSRNTFRKQQAIEAEWDMLVIDEAHHLTEGSPGYALAEALGRVTAGMMLITATPEQLGHRSHFARLRLLDPDRYHNFARFEKEEKQYLKISSLINRLLENNLKGDDTRQLATLSPEIAAARKDDLKTALKSDPLYRDRFVEDLLDRYGTGRAVFRNTRATISGFPERIAHLIPLVDEKEDTAQPTQALYDPNEPEMPESMALKEDPRISWLSDFIEADRDRKILLICSTRKMVRTIEATLRDSVAVDIALFHEDLSLLQRDRNAAWFADPNGAQILLCSEIGSEGRNFQFAHHLVLFDLPMDPELLEQRIGRLDRIGQTSDVHIQVPYIAGSDQEILARWYHEGMNAFAHNVPGAYQIYQKMGQQVSDVMANRQFDRLESCIAETRALCRETARKLKNGRDRLLELNSFRPKEAAALLNDIQSVDEGSELQSFMMDVFHFYGIREEDIAEKTYRLNLALLSTPQFPLPPLTKERLVVTFDRDTGLVHEDMEFLTWDHPMVSGVIDLKLGSENGNCSLAVWPEQTEAELMLEAVFVVECLAPKKWFADRFLPPTPIRALVDQDLEDCANDYPIEQLRRQLKNSTDHGILDEVQVRREWLPDMIRKCHKLAKQQTRSIIKESLHAMVDTLGREVLRRVELKKVNPNISDKEIQLCKDEIEALRQAIMAARPRLDALRLVVCGEAPTE